ncbi:STAS domain-containing protein [Streptomyces sp. NPDC001717]|uniref:STAS domain-containing protein n=1 Tax=Streptomyces sp. NPDC001717 TaxID=3364604 RepID=UPI00369F8215
MGDQEDRDTGLWVSSSDQRTVVHVGGEMDIDRAPMLIEGLTAVITQPGGPREIVLDVAEMTFCDSSGINALIAGLHAAQKHGRNLSLRGPRPQLLRLLELTGTDKLFPITDT